MIKKYFNQHPNATVTSWLHNSSSFINGIKYDKTDRSLIVRIGSEGYEYEVSLDLADEFSRSSSWGKFYNDKIKGKGPKRIIPDVSKTLTAERPSLLSAVLGVAHVGLILAPLHIKLPLKIALTAGLALTEGYLDSKGHLKPPEVEFALKAAAGFSLVSIFKYPLSLVRIIAKSPYGTLKYFSPEKQIIASMTRAQATKTLLTGGQIFQAVGREAQKQYWIRRPPTELAKQFAAAGFKVTRSKAPIMKYPFKSLPANVYADLRKGFEVTKVRKVGVTIKDMAAVGVMSAIATDGFIGKMRERTQKVTKRTVKRLKKRRVTAKTGTRDIFPVSITIG